MKRISVKRAPKIGQLGNNASLGGSGFSGSSKGSTKGSFGHFGSKVVVKSKFIQNNPKKLSSHIKYIEHRQQEKAELFDEKKDKVHRYSYEDNVNKSLFSVHHKIVISPEDRLTPDQLKELGREMMLKLENSKQQEIVWMAAIHDKEQHTKYPHLHIIASGKDSVLKIKKEDLDMIRKEASRFVTREIGLNRELIAQIKEDYKQEIAILDVLSLDPKKAQELSEIRNNGLINEMRSHITIKTLDKFNEKKLQTIASQLFINGMNSHSWVEKGIINILIKDPTLSKDEVQLLKSELTSQIRETKRSLFSGFTDYKVIALKDENLEQGIIKYNRFKEERKELLSQTHTDPEEKIRLQTALQTNAMQIKESLSILKDRYNVINGTTDKTLNQLIRNTNEIQISEKISLDVLQREKEYALRNTEYAAYENKLKDGLILKTYFIAKDNPIEKAIEKTIGLYKNMTGQGNERFILEAPLGSEMSKKLASIDIEKTFREITRMKIEGHFDQIRKLSFEEKVPSQNLKEQITESISRYLKENNLHLSPVIVRHMVLEDITLSQIKDLKGSGFLKEEKQKGRSGYYLTLNEAISTFKVTNKTQNKSSEEIEKIANKYIDNAYFSIQVSKIPEQKDKNITTFSTFVDHDLQKTVNKISAQLQKQDVEINFQKKNKSNPHTITITTKSKLKPSDIIKIKAAIRRTFNENDETKTFREEKLKALKDFSEAVLGEKIVKTPPIIEKKESIGLKNPYPYENIPSERIEKLDKKIIEFSNTDPIRIIEHLNETKMGTLREISEYINGTNFLKNRDELTAKAILIIKGEIEKMTHEDSIKEKIEADHSKNLRSLGIEKSELSEKNLTKITSNIRNQILKNDFNIGSIPTIGKQKQLDVGLEK